MRLQEVGVLFEILRRGLLASLAGEGRGADQCGDMHRQRRGRVAAVLLPAFLRSDRSMADQIAGRFQHHRIRIEILERLGLMQTPGENNGKRSLIQLDAAPVRFAVDPEILVETAVLLLSPGQIDQGAKRDLGAAGSQQAAGAVAHVARPDQIVAFQVVARVLAPGDAQRGDQGTVVGLVFVCQEHVLADVIERAAVAGHRRHLRLHVMANTLPLLDEAPAVSGEGSAQRLRSRDQGVMEALAEGKRQHEFLALPDIEFPGQRDVAVRRTVELPVHAEVAQPGLASRRSFPHNRRSIARTGSRLPARAK